MSTFTVAPARTSSFISDIDYNLVDSQVRVQFANDDVKFYDVTLSAIQELLNPMTSFGFWFNKYCRWFGNTFNSLIHTKGSPLAHLYLIQLCSLFLPVHLLSSSPLLSILWLHVSMWPTSLDKSALTRMSLVVQSLTWWLLRTWALVSGLMRTCFLTTRMLLVTVLHDVPTKA